jgi:hypothetical protein
LWVPTVVLPIVVDRVHEERAVGIGTIAQRLAVHEVHGNLFQELGNERFEIGRQFTVSKHVSFEGNRCDGQFTKGLGDCGSKPERFSLKS